MLSWERMGRVCCQLYLQQLQRVFPSIIFPIYLLRLSPRRDPRSKKGVRIRGANCLKCQIGRQSLLYWTVCAQCFRNRGAICKIHVWLRFRPSALSKQRHFEGDQLGVVGASWCGFEFSQLSSSQAASPTAAEPLSCVLCLSLYTSISGELTSKLMQHILVCV